MRRCWVSDDDLIKFFSFNLFSHVCIFFSIFYFAQFFLSIFKNFCGIFVSWLITFHFFLVYLLWIYFYGFHFSHPRGANSQVLFSNIFFLLIILSDRGFVCLYNSWVDNFFEIKFYLKFIVILSLILWLFNVVQVLIEIFIIIVVKFCVLMLLSQLSTQIYCDYYFFDMNCLIFASLMGLDVEF